MKERLDVLLVRNNFFSSRERAKAAVMEGHIYVDGRISDKPGTLTDTKAEIIVKKDTCPFVSRGGFKLLKAINSFGISLEGRTCMDIGASTGGFTDCMLQHGAAKVYAVDVGYGQLAYSLRNDQRVVNIERCNFRYFDTDSIGQSIDFMSIDVSFISLKLIFPVAVRMLKDAAAMTALIKPQFEAGRSQVGKNGVVRDVSIREQVISDVIGFAADSGLTARGLDFSPITGAKGNVEFLLYLNKGDNIGYNIDADCIHDVAVRSQSELG